MVVRSVVLGALFLLFCTILPSASCQKMPSQQGHSGHHTHTLDYHQSLLLVTITSLLKILADWQAALANAAHSAER